MATATSDPKAALDPAQRRWLEQMASALGVHVGGAATIASPRSSSPPPDEDVAQRQQAAVETALEEWENMVREDGSSNRGDRVDVYARSAGFNPKKDYDPSREGDQGIEWCGAFAGYALTQSGFKDAPSLASYQKARDYFVYRSYTGKVSNEKFDEIRAEQEASGSTRKYFILEGSDSDMAKQAKKPGKYGKDKYGHYDPDQNTFDYKSLPIQPGDVALFKHGHVGMVKSYDPKTGLLETVEGNTGGERADGTNVGANAVVQKKYDLTNDKDRKKFDGFGRPAAGDFKDAAAASSAAASSAATTSAAPGAAAPSSPPKSASTDKRVVPGGGGYVYEQHANGKIFIIQSPKLGQTRIEVKDRKGYDAILAEIGPFPTATAPTAPAAAPAPTGSTSASGLLDQLFGAVEDAKDHLGDVAQDVADAVRGGIDKVADFFGDEEKPPAAPVAAPSAGPTAPAAEETKAEEPDSYRSQTDNPELAGGTCNVTTLAMQLLSLAGGDETTLRETSVDLLKKRGVTAKTSTQLEELLRQLTIAVAGGSTVELKNSKGEVSTHNSWEVAWVLDKVSELFTSYVSKTETIYPKMTQEGYQDKIVPALENGAAIMLSNKLTSSGHIVKLHSVRADGIVIDDPNGCIVEARGAYLSNGATLSAKHIKRIQDNASILDERMQLNPTLRQQLTDLAAAGKGKIPANAGKMNFYSWDEVATYSIGKWANITHKK